jgi:peroxiredoxin
MSSPGYRDGRRLMRTSIAAIVLVLFCAASVQGAAVVKPKEAREPSTSGNDHVGQKIEPFTAVTVTGSGISSLDHRAGVLIITLWGLNCASCLEEMKALQPIYEEYRNRGLKIWAINTEDIGPEEIHDGLQSRGMQLGYDLIPDPGLTITKIFTSWFIPVTVIVDSDGVVQYYKIGFNEADAEKIKAKVGALLVP